MGVVFWQGINMTKEQIFKKFEFDLNTGVFKPVRNFDNAIMFKIDGHKDRDLIIDALDSINYKCTYDYKFTKNFVAIIVYYRLKTYEPFLSHQWCAIFKMFGNAITVNAVPSYLRNILDEEIIDADDKGKN